MIKFSKQTGGLIALCTCTLAALAAGPTTAPTTQQAQNYVAPKTWPLVENATYHFQLNIPDKWKQNQKSDTELAYFLPAPPHKRPDLFMLVSAKCHPTTTDAMAKDVKDELAKNGDVKILKDEAITLGNRPAWLIAADAAVKVTPPPGIPNAKPRIMHTRMYKVVLADNDVSYEVSIEAEPDAFDKDVALFKKVMQTFQWTAPPNKS